MPDEVNHASTFASRSECVVDGYWTVTSSVVLELGGPERDLTYRLAPPLERLPQPPPPIHQILTRSAGVRLNFCPAGTENAWYQASMLRTASARY